MSPSSPCVEVRGLAQSYPWYGRARVVPAGAGACRSSERCPSRDVSRDDRKDDPADRTPTLTCVADRGNRLSSAQCAQLTPDVVWDRDFGSGCDYEVAVAARQISTRRYRGSRRWVESAVRSLCRPVEVDYSRSQ